MAKLAWERRPKETVPAYEAFATYLLHGPERSTANAARALGKSKTLMDRWSGQHDWALRVSAYEEHFQLGRIADTESQREEMLDDLTEIATRGFSIVKQRLAAMIDPVVIDGKEVELPNGQKLNEAMMLKPQELVALLREVIVAGKIAAGLGDPRAPESDSAKDRLRELDPEKLAELERILAPA